MQDEETPSKKKKKPSINMFDRRCLLFDLSKWTERKKCK